MYGLGVLDDCCESCATGGQCSSHGLGFTIPDDAAIDPNVSEQADGSLFSLGSVEALAPIVPASFVNPTNSPLDAATGAAGVVAAPFTGGLSLAASSAFQAIEHIFHFGRGRKEADIITPQQNVIWQYMVNAELASRSGNPLTLSQLVLNLQQLSYNWMRFLGDPRFTDGRASAQAANTIMPYLDGSCGYQPHNLVPMQGSSGPGTDSPCKPAGCNGCDNVWPHDWGYGSGLIGVVRKRTIDAGGTLPPANDVTQGVGVPTLQFPGTNGYVNTGPQAGYIRSPYSGLNPGGYNVGPPQQAGMLDTSTLGIIGLVFLGGFLLSRR